MWRLPQRGRRPSELVFELLERAPASFTKEDGEVVQYDSAPKAGSPDPIVLTRPPYGMLSGWSTWEDGMSDTIQDVTGYRER